MKHSPLLTITLLVILPAAPLAAADLEPTLGKTGRLLHEEAFDGDALPKGWSVKTGGVRVADGVLHATQKRSDGQLSLFNFDLPMQDAAVRIDFKFSGARGGLNIGFNPAAGELRKKGHLLSVMITPAMWNLTEHNDKADRKSQSKALASAPAKFASGQWHTLLLEVKGDDVVVQAAGQTPLRCSSKDFHVRKPGLAFRVLGRDEAEISFDNLRVWELE